MKGQNYMKTELNLRRWNNPYSPKEKLKALNLLKRSDVEFVAHRYHCTVQTIYRWRRIYNGTIESLENKSHRPLTEFKPTFTVGYFGVHECKFLRVFYLFSTLKQGS